MNFGAPFATPSAPSDDSAASLFCLRVSTWHRLPSLPARAGVQSPLLANACDSFSRRPAILPASPADDLKRPPVPSGLCRELIVPRYGDTQDWHESGQLSGTPHVVVGGGECRLEGIRFFQRPTTVRHIACGSSPSRVRMG